MTPERPPPLTWREEAANVADTLRFAYSETLGKWPIMDLAFGIKYLARLQDSQAVASIFAGSNCLQIKGPEIMTQLIHYLRLLKLCMSFSKKTFPAFLEYGGYSHEDVLLHVCKAGFLKPAFTILLDSDSESFLVIIRGMHSMNDMLTAASGYVVPFHYLVLHEGSVRRLVLGYAHFGMVAAAHWIAECASPCLIKAIHEYPAYSIKILGNSLGGGIAALLTYILREHIEFASSTCIVFSPASCMTWDLAESSKDFITTIINGSDIVPTCSLASVDNLRAEVKASSWIRDIWNKRPRFLNVIKHSILALTSCLPFIPCSRTVGRKPQAVKRSARNGAHANTNSYCSCCSCLSAHGCGTKICAIPNECCQLGCTGTDTNTDTDTDTAPPEECLVANDIKYGHRCRHRYVSDTSSAPPEECLCFAGCQSRTAPDELDFGCSERRNKCTAEDVEQSKHISGAPMEVVTEEAAAALEGSEDNKERHHFFPPGRIMHMVVVMPPASKNDRSENVASERSVGIYETRRDLYSKIRLSPNMIDDHYMSSCEKTMELLIDDLRKTIA